MKRRDFIARVGMTLSALGLWRATPTAKATEVAMLRSNYGSYAQWLTTVFNKHQDKFGQHPHIVWLNPKDRDGYIRELVVEHRFVNMLQMSNGTLGVDFFGIPIAASTSIKPGMFLSFNTLVGGQNETL